MTLEKIKFLLISLSLLIFAGFVSADSINPATNVQNYFYVFHLYYDNGRLTTDKDFKTPYDIIPGDFIAESPATNAAFSGKIVNFKNSVADNFSFDPQKGNRSFTRGKISVNAPYSGDASRVDFYDSQNKFVLSVSLSASAVCNDNGICEEKFGENSYTCPSDCGSIPVSVLPNLSPSTSPLPAAGGTSIVTSVIFMIIGIIIIAAVIFFLRRKRGNDDFPSGIPS